MRLDSVVTEHKVADAVVGSRSADKKRYAIRILTSIFGCLIVAPITEADDRIVVRGNYYREDSTRVLQPMISFRKDLAKKQLEVGVDYLLDSITSASIASGAAALGGDKLFTELRHETTGIINGRFGAWTAGTAFRYSTETDYVSRSMRVFGSRELFQRMILIQLAYGYSNDSVYRIQANINNPVQWKSTGDSNWLHTHYLALSYNQIISPRLQGGLSLEGIDATGPQDNPYRSVRNGTPERHPLHRQRMSGSVWATWRVPHTPLTFEPHLRIGGDDWGIQAQSIDMRIHLRMFRNWRIRGRYRYYSQTQAKFWRDDGRYPEEALFASDDPKMNNFHSHTPGLELTWELNGIARFPGLRWLRGAWIQANYNHVFQTSRFGNARLGSLSFSVPF